jgi:hypothetical protein
MTVLDTAYRCPSCQTDRGNTPRDLPCPNCDLSLAEALEVAKDPGPKPIPDWLQRQNRLVLLAIEHDRVAEELDCAQKEFDRRRVTDEEDPELGRLTDEVIRLSAEKNSRFFDLVEAGLKYGELPKLRALIAEGRLPRIS